MFERRINIFLREESHLVGARFVSQIIHLNYRKLKNCAIFAFYGFNTTRNPLLVTSVALRHLVFFNHPYTISDTPSI
jgi:hypothetical protein